MATVKELYYSTKKLYDLLQSGFPEEVDARDNFIQTISDLLDERQKYMENFPHKELNEAEQKVGNEIIKMTNYINSQLESIKKMIGTDITMLKRKRQFGKKYENPYEGPVASYFFDQKGV